MWTLLNEYESCFVDERKHQIQGPQQIKPIQWNRNLSQNRNTKIIIIIMLFFLYWTENTLKIDRRCRQKIKRRRGNERNCLWNGENNMFWKTVNLKSEMVAGSSAASQIDTMLFECLFIHQMLCPMRVLNSIIYIHDTWD